MEYENDNAMKPRLICDLEVSDRPREKAMSQGFKSLSDAELMAIIFATGIKGKSVVELCQDILDQNGNHLSYVTNKTVDELTNAYKGVGKAKALTLLAALELGRRAAEDAAELRKLDPITSSQVAADRMRGRFQWLPHEEFWVMYLNRGAQPVRIERVSQGGTFATVVDVKIILKTAIQCLASNIILFHNHPSGTLRPSAEDDKLTRRIVEGAKAIDVRVNDHIIITDSGYYSYNDKGKL